MKKLFVLFYLTSVFSLAQTKTIFLQGDYGNTSFINPSTKVTSFCPSANLFLVSNTAKNDSQKIHPCFIAGISFAKTTEYYNVQQVNSINYKTEKFYTNQFSFSLGGMASFNLTKTVFFNLGGGFEMATNYTWCADALITLYRIAPTLPTTSLTGYNNVSRQAPYRWNYYHFSFFTRIQLGVKISKIVSAYIGLNAHIYLAKNNVSEEAETPPFNYAPVKLMPNIGLQVKLFK